MEIDFRRMSLIEKVKTYDEFIQDLRDPKSDEVEDLKEAIADNGEHVWRRHQLIEQDAKKLKEESQILMKAAKEQDNKAKRIKKYLKDSLKLNGFDRYRMGDLQFTLSTSYKLIAARGATKEDFKLYPEWIDVSYKWARDPIVTDKIKHTDLIEPVYQWNVGKMKEAYKESPERFYGILKEVETDTLKVTPAKE